MIKVPALERMTDDVVCSHLETRHSDALAMEFRPEPGKRDRRLMARSAWEIYHDRLHAIGDHNHEHVEVGHAC